MPGDDFFGQVRHLLEQQEEEDEGETESESEDLSLVEVSTRTGTKKVQSFCEICILVMQMKERGQPHLCAGLNDQYYVTCVEVLVSLLRADKGQRSRSRSAAHTPPLPMMRRRSLRLTFPYRIALSLVRTVLCARSSACWLILSPLSALVYWLKNGCMHMDQTGPEIVRPCPAINICSWVPNLFSQPPSLVKDGVESLCPKDNKFLPTIPQEVRRHLS
jgi:hypothetical protein